MMLLAGLRRFCLCSVLLCTLGCAALLPALPAHAAWREEPKLAALFAQAGVDGTFVLYDHGRDIVYGCNQARAEVRYQPASTFKVLNSLIAFETGVVKDAQEILPYGDAPQTIKAWEHDMTIREAIAVSNVPLYQGIARRIGLQRMQDFVQRTGYGNADIGSTVDTFWLEGPLAVSAVEQMRFLDALLQRQLPFSERSFDLLCDILPREALPAPGEAPGDVQGAMLFKTGWSRSTQPNVGWLIGWMRLNGRDYPFALNCDMHRMEDAPMRLALARDALRVLRESALFSTLFSTGQ